MRFPLLRRLGDGLEIQRHFYYTAFSRCQDIQRRPYAISRVALQRLSPRSISSYLQDQFLPKATSIFNDLTGYTAVQERKSRVFEMDSALSESKASVRSAKAAYQSIMEERLAVQKDIHGLLQRQASWRAEDVTRFTDLYKRDLALEQAESASKTAYKEASDGFDKSHNDYLNEIRERYVEEQLYSDKIRSASTWWTWGLITFHLILFLVIQTWVEPRKKDALLSQLSVVVQDSFERDRVALREELEPIKERLRPLDLLNVNSSAIMEDTDWVADGHDPIMARTPQETAMAIGGFYLNSPSFLQGLIVGSAASILGFLLLSR